MKALSTAVALTALLAACGRDPTTLALAASPEAVTLGQAGFTTLTVTGSFDGDPLYDGLAVTLETDLGSFAPDEPEQSTSLTTAGKAATARLYAPRTAGTAHVVATLVDPYGDRITARADVVFRTATEPTRVTLDCGTRNIGALFRLTELAVRCRAGAFDVRGQPVEGADIRFLAEAGRIVPGETAGSYVYRPFDGGRQPLDVAPLGPAATGEPRYVDANGRTRNPRDGLVTLVAYTRGKAGGLYPTPYIDANDDDVHQAGEEIPAGLDAFEASQDAWVWTSLRIVWSGPVFVGAKASRVTGPSGPVGRGERRMLDFTLLDANLNVPASNGDADALAFTTSGGVTLDPESRRLAHGPGIALDDSGRVQNGDQASSYGVDSTYAVTIVNDRSSSDTGDQLLTLGAELSRHLTLDADGLATEARTETQLPTVTLTLK